MSDDVFDSEPEDSWDADDTVAEQLENLRRRVGVLRRSLAAMATQREQLRLEHLDTDLAFIINRVLDRG